MWKYVPFFGATEIFKRKPNGVSHIQNPIQRNPNRQYMPETVMPNAMKVIFFSLSLEFIGQEEEKRSVCLCESR